MPPSILDRRSLYAKLLAIRGGRLCIPASHPLRQPVFRQAIRGKITILTKGGEFRLCKPHGLHAAWWKNGREDPMERMPRPPKKAGRSIPVLSLCLLWATGLLPVQPAFCTTEAPLPLATVHQKVAAEFNRLDAGLKGAAQALGTAGLTGDNARAILAELCGGFGYAVDCTAVDPSGRMVTIEPAPFRHFEGKSIGDQEQVKRVMETRKPVLSAVFRAVEGFEAGDIEYPVTTPEGKFLGSVSLLFKPEKLLGDIIVPLVRGMPVDIWAMEKGGLILYDIDTPQIGLNLFTSPLYRPYAELLGLGRRIVATSNGNGVYRFIRDPAKKVVKKSAFWQSISLYGTEWRLVAVHVERDGSGQETAGGLSVSAPTPEMRLKTFSKERSLTAALAGGDKTTAMKLFREFYEATPDIYSVQWVDEKGINRFGYPEENSLADYDYRSNRVPSDGDMLKVLAGRKPAGFEAPLIEGNKGIFTFRPVSGQGRYLGMVYIIRLK